MTTPAEYREFARDCLRWTEQAKDASQRGTLIEVARLWTNAACQLERHLVQTIDRPSLLSQLRTKLD